MLPRPGRAVLRVIPAGGGGGRVVAKVTAPPGVGRVRPPAARPPARALPADHRGARPGHARPENVGFTVGGDWASAGLPRSLALEYRRGSLRLSVGSGYRAVVRLVPPRGGDRVIAKVRGAVRRTRIALPADLVPGAYRAVAVAVGPSGRQGAGARFQVAG